ncbi:hypothetical protein CHARACLAT_033582 [Characodon lateralis]|uniref:Uncharacterized protein n=1 Tax=Characodon lateralis TaxID=208331 RepID=A0ABU7D3H6_9TELE|nr:hypothetical protein [Characodon lateralis]
MLFLKLEDKCENSGMRHITAYRCMKTGGEINRGSPCRLSRINKGWSSRAVCVSAELQLGGGSIDQDLIIEVKNSFKLHSSVKGFYADSIETCLPPLLFILHTDSCRSSHENSCLVKFSDDTALYTHRPLY